MTSEPIDRDNSDDSEPQPIEDVLKVEKLRYLNFAQRDSGLATVPSTSPLKDALDLMRKSLSTGAVVVTDPDSSDTVRGIFTERDYLDKLTDGSAQVSEPIENFMTPAPHTVSSDDAIDKAIRLMTKGGYRHLPVVDNDKLVGLVTTRHIIDYLAEYFPMEIYNLPPRLRENEAFGTREGG